MITGNFSERFPEYNACLALYTKTPLFKKDIVLTPYVAPDTHVPKRKSPMQIRHLPPSLIKHKIWTKGMPPKPTIISDFKVGRSEHPLAVNLASEEFLELN
jgi:hypothetical protein